MAAFDPIANLSWVRISILYSALVVAYQLLAHFALGLPFSPVPLGVALAGAVLQILFYPFRGELVPPRTLNAASQRWLDPDYQP